MVLFVAALYYRFARHDALMFYVFFGAAAIVACFYLFRYGNDCKNYDARKPSIANESDATVLCARKTSSAVA